jgi:RNA polymerase sigma-70 factor (ECF subfamily)
MDRSSDDNLARRALAGDVGAYGELVRRHQGRVFAICLRMMGNRQDAEDMSQEVFIRAFEKLDRYDPERPFGPWVRKVAVNICLNALRGRGRKEVAYQEGWDWDQESARGNPEREQRRQEERLQVQRALMALPAEMRAVIELRHFQGMRYAEMAETLGISLDLVKVRLYRARRRLAKTLTREADGYG